MCADQSSDLVAADEDKSPAENSASKPLNSAEPACATAETNFATCQVQECENSSGILEGMRIRLFEIDKGSHMPIKPTSGSDQNPDTESSENCRSDDLLSVSHSPSNEALDLTDCARKRANTATKRKLSDYIATSKEVKLDDPQTPANNIDNCSESSSVVCIKDEFLTSTDTDTDWSASLTASIPLQTNCYNNRSCQKPSISLDNAHSSNFITEEVTNASLSQSDQVSSSLCLL